MLDSNVLFSALAFPGSIVEGIVNHIKRNHTIVLSEYIIDETERIILKKRKEYYGYFKLQLDLLTDEIVNKNGFNSTQHPYIEDIDDIPILVAAIEAQVDLLITGDSDFDIVKIDKPRILKPKQYADEYMR